MTLVESRSTGHLGSVQFVKDWDLAADLRSRQSRLLARRSKGGLHQKPTTPGGSRVITVPPLVRGPKRSGFADTAWHEQRALSAFKRLDVERNGQVHVGKLAESFADLGAHIDEETFFRYADDLKLHTTADSFFARESPLKASQPPAPRDYVDKNGFVNFHNTVWKNQPLSLRLLAGDPTVGGSGVGCEVKAFGTKLKTSSSAPQLLREQALVHRRENETQAHAAFERYAQGPSAGIERDDVPRVLDDLGISLGGFSEVEAHELDAFLRNWFEDQGYGEEGDVSFPMFVRVMNDYIVEAQRLRSLRTHAGASKARRSLAEAMRYGRHNGPEDDEELTPRSKARDCMESLLLGADEADGDEQLTPRAQARAAVERALGVDGDEELTPRSMAREAVAGEEEAGAAADHACPGGEAKADELTPRTKARQAIEATFDSSLAESQVRVNSSLDFVDDEDFKSYTKSLAKTLSRGHEILQSEVVHFLESEAKNLEQDAAADTAFPPCDHEGQRIELTLKIVKFGAGFKVGYKSRYSVLS